VKPEAITYARLPRAGLGNKLLVWGRAFAFARTNGLRLFVSPWSQLPLGPILRGERSARLYRGYFDDPCAASRVRRLLVRSAYDVVFDPEIARVARPRPRTAYVFRTVPHWSDYFAGIREHRAAVHAALLAMLAPPRRTELDRLASPIIGIHVRHGDFRPLRDGEDFARVGQVRTPLAYFRETIEGVRELHGSTLPVTVFSDGEDRDLAELLKLPGVRRAQPTTDIVDLLLLARSKVIIPSPGSSFGMWSAFLSDSSILWHPSHFRGPSRPADVNQRAYEGPISGPPSEWPEQLREDIQRLAC